MGVNVSIYLQNTQSDLCDLHTEITNIVRWCVTTDDVNVLGTSIKANILTFMSIFTLSRMLGMLSFHVSHLHVDCVQHQQLTDGLRAQT